MLIFLDFDGVTHPIVGNTFNSDCISLLSTALEGTDAEIVITSTWRENFQLNELCGMLGNSLGGKVVGKTPIIDDPFLKYVRYHEVQKYLSETGQTTRDWIALDDTRGFYPPDAPVIWCNPQTGITESEAAKLHAVLKSPKKS